MIVFKKAYPTLGMPEYQGVTQYYEGQIVELSTAEEKFFVDGYFAEVYDNKYDYYQPYDLVSDAITGLVTSIVGPNGSAAPVGAAADNALRSDLLNTDQGKGGDLVGFKQAGTGAVTRTVDDKLREVVSVKDFGAVGDGVTDDTVAIQNAINATPRGGVLIMEANKQYRIASTLNGYDISIEGNGARIISTGNFTQLQIRLVKPSVTTSIAASQGQYIFDLGVAHGIEVGDIVRMKSPDSRLTIATYTHGFLATVTAVSGNTITLDRSAYANFTITSVEVFGASSGVFIDNLHAQHELVSASGAATWIVVGNNVLFKGCSLISSNNLGARGITATGTNILVENCYMRNYLNVDGDGGTGRVGYGSEIFGNNITWLGCSFIECKHGQSTGGRSAVDTSVSVINCYYFARNTLIGHQIDCHANVLDTFTAKDCFVDTYESCVGIRNGAASVTGCYFYKSSAVGPFVRIFENTPSDVSIQENTCTGSTTNFVFCGSAQVQAPTLVKNIKIDGNTLNGQTVFSVTGVGSFSDVSISNNSLTACAAILSFANTSFSGLKVDGNYGSVTNLIADAGTTQSIAFSNFGMSKNRLSATSGSNGFIRIVSTGSLTSFANLMLIDNEFDCSALASTSYVFNLNNIPSMAGVEISGNTIKRNANFRVMQILGSSTALTQLNSWVVQGNTLDGQIKFVDCNVKSMLISGNNIDGSLSGNIPSISFDSSLNTSVLDMIEISQNTINAGTNVATSGAVSFTGLSTFTSPVVVRSNGINTASDLSYAVIASAATTNNKIEFKNNTVRRGFLDSSNTFFIRPVANFIYGPNKQVWKGGVIVDEVGEYYAEAAPTTGSWSTGERVYDPTPAASGRIGFVCVTAGTPGTWKTWGPIDA